MRQTILPNPPGPGLFRTCHGCQRWFALKLESTQRDDKAGALHTYRCKFCDARVMHARRHPRHAV